MTRVPMTSAWIPWQPTITRRTRTRSAIAPKTVPNSRTGTIRRPVSEVGSHEENGGGVEDQITKDRDRGSDPEVARVGTDQSLVLGAVVRVCRP